MEHIKGKKAQLGNTVVNGAVREGTFALEPADKLPEFLPGDILRLLMKNGLEIKQINPDVSGIRSNGVVSEATEGDHLPINI